MSDDDSNSEHEEKGESLITMGATLGIAGIGAATVAGVTCPICVVGAPFLIGAGLWKRYQSKSFPGETIECEKE